MARAILLCGGRGTRLRPYTTILPKALMPIGDVPILDVLIRQLGRHGFDDVVLTVGHLAELLMAYFNERSRPGVRLSYSREEQPLGTAGPIGLITAPADSFLVMNGDILTDLDYGALLAAHTRSGSSLTVASIRREHRIDSGVLQVDAEGRVRRYVEKPTLEHLVSIGAYALAPHVVDFIPRNQPLDIPELIARLLDAGKAVDHFPHAGHWFDIGREDDYRAALAAFEKSPNVFLNGTAGAS